MDTSGHEWTRVDTEVSHHEAPIGSKCDDIRPPLRRDRQAQREEEALDDGACCRSRAPPWKEELAAYMQWYIEHRPHSTLSGATPGEVLRGELPAAGLPPFEPRIRHPLARSNLASFLRRPVVVTPRAPRRGLDPEASPRHPSSVRSVRMRRCACRSPRRNRRRQPRRPRGLSDGGKMTGKGRGKLGGHLYVYPPLATTPSSPPTAAAEQPLRGREMPAKGRGRLRGHLYTHYMSAAPETSSLVSA